MTAVLFCHENNYNTIIFQAVYMLRLICITTFNSYSIL